MTKEFKEQRWGSFFLLHGSTFVVTSITVCVVTWSGEAWGGCGPRGAWRPHTAASRVSCLLLQHGPVEHVVVLVVQRAEQNAEQLSQIHVVGRLLEPQSSAVVQVHGKLCWEPLRKTSSLSDPVVFLTQGEVQQNYPQWESDCADNLILGQSKCLN